jgi:hypothetical protein
MLIGYCVTWVSRRVWLRVRAQGEADFASLFITIRSNLDSSTQFQLAPSSSTPNLRILSQSGSNCVATTWIALA